MTLLRGGALAGAVVLAGVVATGCAARVDEAGASLPRAPLTTAFPTTTPTTPPPTFVPPNGPCQTRFEVAEAAEAAEATPAPPTSGRVRVPADAPPNHVDNNRWKHRAPLPLGPHAAAVAVAERLRPVLERLCGSGDFARESTLSALTGTGRAADEVYAWPFDPPLAEPTPGVVYGIHLGDRACVIGSLRPGEVLIRVDGTTREGTCHEPSSH
ncbi:hypothetical protein [Saccharothrix xinjiangensis]|uniref:LppP/LprE lipoprotein n=1 Tax=Saccharothrix xinjiangensis TaxID=204798 RepID=A0ABV9XS81_9PSEU